MRRPVRNVFLLGILVGLVIALVRALRAEGSTAAVGAGARPLPPGRPEATPAEDRPTAAAVAAPRPEPSPTTSSSAPRTPPPPPAGSADEPPPDVVPPVAVDPVPEAPATADPAAGSEATSWVEPVEGECPPGFPVKVKESSGIYHVPEGAFHGRTVPDRCYPSAAAAEADGFRPSKR